MNVFGRDLDGVVLRRRVLRAAKSVSDYLGVLEPKDGSLTAAADYLDRLMSAVEYVLTLSESATAGAVTDVHARFQETWPESCAPSYLLSHLRCELREIQQAIADAEGRPDLRKHVVEECGDAMLLLARLALLYGAESGLRPIAITVTKTQRRLAHFETLVPSMGPVAAWRMAKSMVKPG